MALPRNARPLVRTSTGKMFEARAARTVECRVVRAEGDEHHDQGQDAGIGLEQDDVDGNVPRLAGEEHAPRADAVGQPADRKREQHVDGRGAGEEQGEVAERHARALLERQVDERVADRDQAQHRARGQEAPEPRLAQQDPGPTAEVGFARPLASRRRGFRTNSTKTATPTSAIQKPVENTVLYPPGTTLAARTRGPVRRARRRCRACGGSRTPPPCASGPPTARSARHGARCAIPSRHGRRRGARWPAARRSGPRAARYGSPGDGVAGAGHLLVATVPVGERGTAERGEDHEGLVRAVERPELESREAELEGQEERDHRVDHLRGDVGEEAREAQADDVPADHRSPAGAGG